MQYIAARYVLTVFWLYLAAREDDAPARRGEDFWNGCYYFNIIDSRILSIHHCPGVNITQLKRKFFCTKLSLECLM